jgi:hypothetical protein
MFQPAENPTALPPATARPFTPDDRAR